MAEIRGARGRIGGEKRNEREEEIGITRKEECTETFLHCRKYIERSKEEQVFCTMWTGSPSQRFSNSFLLRASITCVVWAWSSAPGSRPSSGPLIRGLDRSFPS